MTHTTKTPSKPPTDTGMTARKRWNELDHPAMQALAVIRGRVSDAAQLRPSERAIVVRMLEVERLLTDADARAHVVLDRHGIAR